jgi:hypothetical protein
MKLLLESWKSYTEELLNEIKMEQVTPRFKSRAFLNAFAEKNNFEKEKEEGGWVPDWSVWDQEQELTNTVPEDIKDKYKPEALNWLISTYIQDKSELNIRSITKSLEIFYQIKESNMDRLLSVKDINSIKTYADLIRVVEEAKPAWEEYKQKKANLDAESGTNKIYEDDRWDVYIPENKGAACRLGKSTEWCTAAPGLNYYENYHKPNDPLIIFISKEDPSEKYQFHYGTEQFMDKHDRQVDNNGLRYELHSIVANLNKLPEQIREKAKELSKNYERLPNGGYKIEGKFGGKDGYNTTVAYYNSDYQRHREDGPALIQYYDDGFVVERWYLNGMAHREDGPAVIDTRYDMKSWYLYGEQMSQEEWEQKRKQQSLQEMIVQELRKLIQERKLGKPSSETNLGDWFKRKGAPGKKGGWVDCNTCRDGKCKPCGRQEGEKRSKYPRCRPTPSQCKGYKRRGSNLQREE